MIILTFAPSASRREEAMDKMRMTCSHARFRSEWSYLADGGRECNEGKG